MKLKKLLYLTTFLLISCGNNTSSFLSTSEDISFNEDKSVITFNKDSIICSSDIQYDENNSNNIIFNNNYLELTNSSSFAFSLSKPLSKIELYLINEPTSLYVGIINKYNVKAQYDLEKEDKLYYYNFAEYLKANHLYIESKELTIIEKIIVYF